MRIGFFDSGIGGITVLHKALQLLPKEDYIYYADTEHVPYGIKNKEEVKGFILEAVEFMSKEGIKALVVACNTATSIAINDLRRIYSFPILGMEPAVKPAVEKNCSKRIMVTATPLTLQEEKYQNLISRLGHAHIVDGVALPELVEFAENRIFDEAVIIDYLHQMLLSYHLHEYGTVVLGCTHFPFFKNCFRKLFPEDTDIIDGSLGTVNYLKKTLAESNMLNSTGHGEIQFYSSGIKEDSERKYREYLYHLQRNQS
jgi:glutamate racemase